MVAQRAIVIGASSGIGKELALLLAHEGYRVCITGRRTELLEAVCNEHASITSRQMDVTQTDATTDTFSDIVREWDGVDMVIISAGTGSIDPDLPWSGEKETIDTNVTGFTALANAAYHQFVRQGHGHLVGISSIAALRGGPAPAYNASKAFMSSYLEGLRCKVAQTGKPIAITDIRPGFVDTDMAKGEGLFWVQPPAKATKQILSAIRKRKKVVYITKRWRLIAWALKLLPDFIYLRMQ